MKCMSTLIGLLGACGLTALSATAATTGSAATTSSGDQAWVQLWENGPKWATCNLGASAPEETGKYFWWGDTVGYTPVNGRFTGINFEAGEDPASSTRKKTQAELIAGGWLDASTHLLSDAHDAAKAQWGGDWRMPTHMELDGLLSKCDTVWTTQGGVNGLLVTGRGAFAGNSIFLPAAGYGDSFGQLSCVSSTGGYGMYWSSSQFADALPSGASPVAFASYGSWRLYFGSQAIKLTSPIETRHLGLTIRPVCGAATVVPPVPPTTVDDQPDCVQLWENGPYWATRNVGATKPSDPGLYFMWSETVGHTKSESSAFTSANCPAYGKDEAELRAAGILQDDSYCLAPQYDAAFQHLGEGWRMPSFTLDIKLLQLNCTWTSTTQDGVAGFLITGKGDYADRSIFWPNAGHIDSYRNFVDRCCYWSGSVYDGSTNARHTLNGGGEFNALRYCGMPVRAIRDTPPEAPPAVTPTEGSLVVDTTVSDHCVLQRGVVNKVKGTATPGATVKVTFGGVSATAVAGANGDFVVSFNPGAANATGRDLVVSDTVNTVTVSDVLVGDVFYLSGQSNVRFEVEAYNKDEALADCDYPNFRMMVMPSENSGRIAATDKDLPCSWIASSSTTCTAMSSFGFFLGRELIKSKNVPIGIVSAAVKGTDIASWLPNGGCDKYMASRCDHIAVKGAIWYQGESDALNYSDRTYPQKLKNLIQYWRTNRGNSNLPVVVVQLPRYRDTYKNCGDTEKINCWGIFRVDQDLAIAEVDNAVCVPTHDYGAEYNIHPSDKHLMGARIALAVRSLMYGDAVAYRCPYPTGAVKSEDGSSVTVSFPSSTVLSFSTDTASESFGAESDMFSVGGVHVKPTISADGHSLVFSGSFADATSVDYALCGFPQILVRDANGFPMPPFSLALSSGGEDPVDPTDEPTGESDRQWTAEDYDPAAWTPLANNILAGLTATAGGTGNLAYDAKDVTKLTDGKVSATADKSEVAGLCPGAELVWTFAEPQTLEKIRVSSLMNPEGNGKLFAGISVADILVQRSGSSDWVSLGVSFSRSGSATAGGAQYATLSDPVLGYLAADVTAVKFVQGKVEAFGNYYSEMEAVGRKSSDSPTYPPAMSGFKVRPWGESAEFSGTIVSLGSGATSCDVYLACGADAEHLGAPVKIYTGNAGAFHYELEGLSQSTGYAYSLAVSNNAATVASCAVSGEFTTTAEVHPDWSAYKWAVIGDSLTDPTLNPYAGNFYYNFVARDTGIQLVYTNGVGSTGYKNRQNENRCFYQRLLTDPLPSDVDVVTIFGSVNDWGQVRNAADAGSPSDRIEDGKTTLAAYMNKAIDVVQAQAPGAKLILAGSLYYYNVVGEAHARANETLRAVAEARGIPFYDWLTEDPNDPLDFHQIANDPTAEGSFAKRYARDCPSTIIPGETSFGHPSAEYHEAWLSPHFRGILTTAIASVKPVALGEPVARPLTDYNGNTVSIAFTGDIPDGAEVSAKVTIGGVDYAGEIGEGVVTFEVPSDAVTSGNVYAGKITVTVGGVEYTKDVTLEQGMFKVDEDAEWIAESAASFESSGAWSGDQAEVSGGVIAVSNALFTAAKAAPEDAVVTITSTFGFNNASDEDFNSDAQAGVKVVKVGGFNRYAFLTGDGVVTNLTAAADVTHAVAVKVTIDKNADTVVYEIGGTEFGPFAAVDGKDAVSKVRYTGATEVASLDGSYRVEFLDTNLASVGGAEYATVADALAAGEAGAVQLLWDASWTPAAIGDYNIATNGHFLAIGGELAYQVKDNGDGTVTVTVTGGEAPDTPVAGSITLSGGEVKVAVANAQSGFWYTLAKTTDLKQSFVVADDAQWVSGEELLADSGELTIALGEGETAAFYRVVVSETAPTLK